MSSDKKDKDDDDRLYPLARLSEAIRQAMEPAVREISQLKMELTVFTGLLNERRNEPLDPLKVKDLESAIRAAGLWECEDLHCRNCSVEQNLACMKEKGIGPKGKE